MTTGLLLDTHIWIWLLGEDPGLRRTSIERIEAAGREGALYVQAFSLWEVAMLESKGRLCFRVPIREWFHRALALSGLGVIGLEPDIVIDCNRLPGGFHRDPADRMLAATARVHGLTLVTRDQAMLNYASAGYLNALQA